MPTAKTATIARRIVLTAIRQHQHDYCRIYYYLKLKSTEFSGLFVIKEKRSFGCGFYLQTVCVLVIMRFDYAVLLNPPKIANNAKNIEIGRMEITVQAICFALVHASLPSGFAVASGQSIAASTSEYIRIPMIRPTATPMNPMMYDISIMLLASVNMSYIKQNSCGMFLLT